MRSISTIFPPTFSSACLVVGFALAGLGCAGGRDIAAPAVRPTVGTSSLERSPDATEVGYFNGLVYRWQFPSGGSNDQRELVLPDCFRVGPDFTLHTDGGPVAVLYAIFLPGANQHSCPDGSDIHDHVLSAVPGTAGYATLWDLKEVWPGENFTPSIMPITSESALLQAEKLHQVMLIDDEILLKANVLGPGQ
jgi:hypothetical protein